MKNKNKAPDKSSGPGGFDPALIEQQRQSSLRDDGRNPGRQIPDVPLARHVNHTPFWSQYYQSVDNQGEVFHTVVTRVSYDMSTVPRGSSDGVLGYAAQQSELAMGDVFADPANPQSSELLWESDFCPYKPRCDVLIVNAASRPPLSNWQRSISHHRNPDLVPSAKRWSCAVALAWTDDEGQPRKWFKRLDVTGPRQVSLLGRTSGPKEASEVLLGWHKAFGGPADERNPLGVGHTSSKSNRAPQQEVGDQPYRGAQLSKAYPPAGFGPLGKTWLPRRTLAGTYDNAWLKDQWPLPPKDFDFGYWNCAPQDQQIDYPTPGAEIRLLNLWPPLPAGQRPPPGNAKTELWRGKLPMHQLFVLWRLHSGPMLTKDALLDTLIVDLQAQRIDAVYRCVMSAKAEVRAVETRLEKDPQQVQAQLDALGLQLHNAQNKERRDGR